MPRAYANGVEIEYETFGHPSNRPLLLVMGLGMQMIGWDDDFCAALVDSGHFVIRFDNRDVGLSTKLAAAGVPNIIEISMKAMSRQPAESPYSLDDMADDAAAVLDAVGLASAHVCGASMGGMIVQTLAIRKPERVRSLTSIMSTTGDSSLPPPTPEAMSALIQPPPPDRDGAIEAAVRVFRTIGSPGFLFDDARVRAKAALGYDRCFHPEGVARQLAAIIAHGSRVEALCKLRVPTLVIHGDADPLVSIEGARDTARCIADAELMVIEGMGHDLPVEVWPRVVAGISALTARAS
jgi:pimeloyl-ACP methyl ester carboxylesterase